MHQLRTFVSPPGHLASPLRRLLRSGLLVAIGIATSPPAPGDTVLETFPLIVECGHPARTAPGPIAPSERDAALLSDVPFSLERGYGYVGGVSAERTGVLAFGGRPHWPLVWREGMEKYIFRVPRGQYLVSLTFIETDVAEAGLRVFDVTAEDRELFHDVDLFSLAGDFAWVTLQGRVQVYDGWLDLRFVPADGSRPPRLSRLRLERWEEAAETVEAAVSKRGTPELEALGAPGCVVLSWSSRTVPGVVGYGLFRSEAPAGPFRKVTETPVRGSRYVDHHVVVGRAYRYRICAIGLDGRQGELSQTVEAVPRRPEELGLPVYNLRVPLESLRRAAVQGAGEARVAAELVHEGAVWHVFLSYDTALPRWQRKKSFIIEVDRDRSRPIERRTKLYLSAEAGDPSFLRELLSQEACRTLGLAAPFAKPVVLMVNNRFEGVYLDREYIGVRFRRRTRLESRSGLLARSTRGDRMRLDWEPYGEKIGKPGKIFNLTWFIHELNRLGTGEAGGFLETRLYLERCIDRVALAIIAGMEIVPRDGYLLEDSRTRKWEWFRERSDSGAWSLRDFEPIQPPGPEDVAAALTRGTLFERTERASSWSVLATRLWNQPSIRERVLARIEALIADGPDHSDNSGKLSPRAVDGFIDRIVAQVGEAVRLDPHRAPARQSLSEVPALVKKAYRARVTLLESAIRAERSRDASRPVVLSEALLRPAEGMPWIELRNSKSEAVSLDEYSLSSDPAKAGVRLSGTIPAGGYLTWSVEGSGLSFPPPGGTICLWRNAEGPGDAAGGGTVVSGARLVDLLYYGHQTEGVPYGRRPEDDVWGFLGRATPGAENDGRELSPPPYTFRHQVELEKNGDVMLWMLPRVTRRGREERPDELFLVHRAEGQRDFERIALRWDKTRHQFLIGLKKEDPPRRLEYFLLGRSPDGVERVYPLAAPELRLSIPVLPDLKINEVLPRPDRSQGQEEFIEIHNPTDRAIDLEGMYLTDRRSLTTKWRIPPGNIIPPGGYAVFYTRGQEPGTNVDFSLRNSGEFLGLYGRIEEGNLPIDTIGFRAVRAGHSYGRTEDGTGGNFRAWKDPTPGARNLPKIPEEFLRKE